jgi:hypothetical protein
MSGFHDLVSGMRVRGSVHGMQDVLEKQKLTWLSFSSCAEQLRCKGRIQTSTSCHLSCVPKKGGPKKGTRRKFFTPCSVVLGTFRKLAFQAQTVRNASPSDSVACLNFRMGLLLSLYPNPHISGAMWNKTQAFDVPLRRAALTRKTRMACRTNRNDLDQPRQTRPSLVSQARVECWTFCKSCQRQCTYTWHAARLSDELPKKNTDTGEAQRISREW